MSQAVEAVGKMLRAYPNARDGLRDGYVGTIAALLCKYPRAVALRCADPLNGVCTVSKFLPTVAHCVEWLEREQRPLRDAFERERRSREQLEERREFDAQQKEESPEKRAQVWKRIKGELEAHGFNFGDTPGAWRSLGATFKQYTDEELRKLYPKETA
jgi:hypothetical protein